MLSNSISVMKRQRNELNLTELHCMADQIFHHCEDETLAIKKPFTIEKDGRSIDVILHHAGHVAGAVSVEIKSPKEKFYFSRYSL